MSHDHPTQPLRPHRPHPRPYPHISLTCSCRSCRSCRSDRRLLYCCICICIIGFYLSDLHLISNHLISNHLDSDPYVISRRGPCTSPLLSLPPNPMQQFCHPPPRRRPQPSPKCRSTRSQKPSQFPNGRYSNFHCRCQTDWPTLAVMRDDGGYDCT